MTGKNITTDTVPPNVKRLAEYIQSKRNPERVTAALLAYLGRGGGNGKSPRGGI